MSKFCVGIDISKLSFYAAIKVNGKEKTKSFSNNENGFTEFLSWLHKYSSNVIHCCMESTGKYGFLLAEFLHKNGCHVSVVNPSKIKFYMKSMLIRNKTDKADAKHILSFCEYFNPAQWKPVPEEITILQELTKRLDVLTNMLLQEKNRLENVSKTTQKSITEHIEYLNNEIKDIEKVIKNHINSYPQLKEKSQLLLSVPGIGKKTLAKILAFLGDIDKYDKAKNVASFIGLTPQHFQSGTSLNKCRLSKTGDADLRKMFYMPTLVAIKHNPIIKEFYERLVAKGKAKKQAICAAMRKLVHIIYGVLKNKEAFNPN